VASEILKRDQNSAVVLGGVTDDANQEIRMLRVDPATNRLLISVPGGTGSFTTIFPTSGVVDGNNKVFVFSTAAAKPSFAVLDGVWYTALDQTAGAGTNWSWSGTTLTTIIPPSSMVFIVV